MATQFSILKLTLEKYNKAFINNQNRLESRPRADEFEDSLRAEVRDPLWMLCRQWQFGEFIGEDAGTANQARILGRHYSPNQLVLNKNVKLDYNINKPLETVVERETLKPDLFLRAQMGRHLLKIMKQHDVNNWSDELREQYPLNVTPETADKEGVILSVPLNGRLPDGFQAFQDMQSGDFMTWVNAEVSSSTQRDRFADVQDAFLRWFGHLYEQPGPEESTWRDEHLEYGFALDLPSNGGGQERLTADQFASGRLEWFSFDKTKSSEPAASTDDYEEVVQSFIPTMLEFSGMPHPRYWQMEENQTDFGKIDGAPTNLLGVLLAEYGLTYSNDWMILPYPLAINTVCEVKGIVVKDVFGMHFLVEPAIDDPETDYTEFAVFHHTERDEDIRGQNLFYLTPAVGKLQAGSPLEKINFMRDEMTNMVWAIEHTVPSEAGMGRDVKTRHFRLPQDYVPADEASQIRYVLGSTVPENWIPFIPVHEPVAPGETPREIRLQRARMPQAPAPKSQLLTEVQPVYFVAEEEVPRAGTIIERNFQRTRWLNGKTYLWVGRHKMAGRGEGWSGLMFDQILQIQRQES